MAGKDHVVAGWLNKARVAMAHVLPDPLVAASARSDMMPKEEAEQQQRQLITALGIAAAVINWRPLVANAQKLGLFVDN